MGPSRSAVVAACALAGSAVLAASSLPVGAAQEGGAAVKQAPRSTAPPDARGAAKRTASASAHKDLDAAAAAQVARTTFAPMVARRPAMSLATGELLAPNVAKVRGRSAIAVSSLPLRSSVGSGSPAPLDLDWRAGKRGFQLANPVRAVVVGERAPDGARFSDDGIGFAPAGAAAAAGRVLDGSVFFGNVAQDADYLVAPRGAGLEAMFVLRSADSPEQVALEYRLDPGLTVRASNDASRSAEIVRGDTVIAATSAVRAFDAEGASVPVRASVQDGRLVVALAHRGKGLPYPILIDPTTYYVGTALGYFVSAPGAPLQGELWDFSKYGWSGPGQVGDWGELTYTPPGTAYVTLVGGTIYNDNGTPANSALGLRRTNGTWAATPYTGPGWAVQACLIASCGEPVASDSPTNDLAYFSGTKAVFRVDVQSAGAVGPFLEYPWFALDDPDDPTLSGVSSGVSGWITGGTRTASATAADAGLGVIELELLKAGTVIGEAPRSCSPAWQSSCAANWTASINYDAGALPEGITSLGLRARDAVDHLSALSSWDVKVDRTAPTVALSGSATTPFAPGNRVTISSDDGTTAIPRAGIRRLHVKVDGVAKPAIEVNCTGGCPRTNVSHFDLDAGEYSEGAHTVTVRAEDDAGHLSTVATIVVYVFDDTAVDRGKLGLENYFTYESAETGADTAAHVNVANGNVVWHSTPIVNAGRGLSSVVNLTYNSQDRGGYLGSLIDAEGMPIVGGTLQDLAGVAYGEAGIGFSLGISGVTRLNEPLGGVSAASPTPNQIRLTDADGTRHLFTRSSSNWYTSPPGVELALRYKGAGAPADRRYAATRPDGVTHYFDADGYQTYITDRNDNTVRYEYETYSKVTGQVSSCTGTPAGSLLCSKRVVRVVDPAGVDAEPTPATPQGATAAARSLHITYDSSPMLLIGGFGGPYPPLCGPVGGAPGRITRIVDHARRVTDFTYDSSGYLIELTQGEVLAAGGGPSNTAAVRPIELAYAGSGPNRVLTGITDPRDHTTAIAYEDAAAPGPTGDHSVGRRADSVTNRRNNATTFEYATAGTTVSRPGGADTLYETDGAGRVQEITDDHGTITELDWSNDNYISRYTLAAGTGDAATTELIYTRLGDIETLTDPHDRVTSFTYRWGTEDGPTNGGIDDGSQYVTDLITMRRPAHANPTYFPDPTVTFGVDNDGNVTSRRYAGDEPAEIHYPPNSRGLADYELDELDNKTSFADYDPNGLPRTVVDPRQNALEPSYAGTWRYSYDAVGNLLAVTDPRGTTNAPGQPYTTSFVYDAFDRVRSSLTPRCSTCSDPEERFTERFTAYDANGNVMEAKDGTGAITTRAYTPMDQTLTENSPAVEHEGEQNPAAEVVSHEYDERENLIRVTSPNGTRTQTADDYSTTIGYDTLDRVETETQLSRGSQNEELTTSYAYDLRDNVIGVADPRINDNGVDPVWNASHPETQRWAYVYDLADNQVQQIEDPSGLALRTIRGYDGNDNLSYESLPRGNDENGVVNDDYTTYFFYDIRDDVISEVRDDHLRVTVYARRDDGKITSVTSPRGVASSAPDDFKTSYAYNANGEISQLTLPSAPGQRPSTPSTVKYERNAVGDPEAITDPRNRRFTNEFWDTGDLKTTPRPNWWAVEGEMVRERTPDEWMVYSGEQEALPTGAGDYGKLSRQKLPGLLPKSGSTDVFYDEEMRLARIVDAAGKVTRFTRDALGRLKQLEQPFKPQQGQTAAVPILQEYRYDHNGNLRRHIDGRDVSTTTDYDQFDRWVLRATKGALSVPNDPDDPAPTPGEVNAVEETEATWDPNGNQLTEVDARDQTTAMTYDAVDRLLNVKDAENQTTNYGYDQHGNVVCERTPRGWTEQSQICEAGNFTTTRAYNQFDELTRVSVVPALVGETIPAYDSCDGSVAVQRIDTCYEYDRDGNPVKITAPGAKKTPNGSIAPQITEQLFDGRDRPWVVGEGSGSERTITVREYDWTGNLRRIVNPKGTPSINFANPGPGLAQLTSDDSIGEPPAGNPSEVDDNATYQATVFQVNDDNQLVNRWLPTGAYNTADRDQYIQHFEYDQRGRVQWIDAPYKQGSDQRVRVSYLHHDNGWISQSSDTHTIETPAGEVTDGSFVYDYDRQGNQIRWESFEDPEDVTPIRTVHRNYYPNGLLSRREAVKQGETTRQYSYGYNLNRSMERMVDGELNRTTRMAYDNIERQVSVNELWASGKDTKFAYDEDGNTRRRWTGGTLNANVTDGIENAKKVTFTYDSLGRERVGLVEPRDSGDPDRETKRTWWPSGQLSTVSRQNNKVVEETFYDTVGRVARRHRTPQGVNTRERIFDYDGNSNRTDEYRFAGSQREDLNLHEYNSRDQLMKWTRGVDARRIKVSSNPDVYDRVVGSFISYEVNGAGSVTKTTDHRPNIDPNQTGDEHTITTENTLDGFQLEEANITSSRDPGPGSPVVIDEDYHYKYSADNGEMLCAGTIDDSVQNPSAPGFCDDGVKYEYDAFSRLRTATDPTQSQSQNSSYTYDGLDRRDVRCQNGSGVSCTGSNAKRYDYGYVGMGEQLDVARDPNTPTQSYDYDSVLNRIGQDSLPAGGPHEYRSYFLDPNGTVIGLENDADGEVAGSDRYDFDPFGKEEGTEVTPSSEAGDNPFRFQSHHYDSAVQTYDMQARAYRPDVTRFTTPDRFEDAMGDFALQSDPLTQDRYAFGAGNPVNNIEFDGHEPATSYDRNAKQVIKDLRPESKYRKEDVEKSPDGPDIHYQSSTDAEGLGAYSDGPGSYSDEKGRAAWERNPTKYACQACPSEATKKKESAERAKRLGGWGDFGKCALGSASFGLVSPEANRSTTACKAGSLAGDLAGGGPVGSVGKVAAKQAGKRLLRKGGDDAAGGARKAPSHQACGMKSFTGPTLVMMADGTKKPIRRVRAGDSLWATDPLTRTSGPRRVTHTWVHPDRFVVLVAGGERIVTTEDHPFWNETDRQWQRVDELDRGDQLLTADGQLIEFLGLRGASAGQAYNLTVADLHTYFVGASSVLVHNAKCDEFRNPNGRLRRFQGPKPTYTVNPAHVPGQGLRRGKTPLPNDAEAVYRSAVPNHPDNPTAWFGRNQQGAVYRFSNDNVGGSHFSGIVGRGDGARNFSDYARLRLEGQ